MEAPRDPSVEGTPYDAEGRVDVAGAPGWKYLPFEQCEGEGIAVTLEAPDGARARFVVPAYLSRGAELGEVARIVIRARERMERSAGLGA